MSWFVRLKGAGEDLDKKIRAYIGNISKLKCGQTICFFEKKSVE